MGPFDWFRRDRRKPEPPLTWNVYRAGSEVVAEDGRGGVSRASLAGARNVRVVPLTGGSTHTAAYMSGWQVALGHAEGDALLGKPIADWRVARDLAQLVCEKAGLPLDDLTQALFSRVGQFTPAKDT